MIVEPAPAKLNLALHVRRRRADGYHDIETLFAFCRDGDELRIAPAASWSFAVEGPFAAALTAGTPNAAGSTNLVVRAAEAFRAHFPDIAPQAITLAKRLPVASGIGGGSADAAATLRGLARLAGIAIDDERLMAMAGALGADVPACLLGRTAMGTGRGDDLVLVDGLAGTPVLLVNPRVAVSTAAVFAQWNGIDGGPIPEGLLLARVAAARNDLQPAASALVPEIGAVLIELERADGVRLARMSGSGATCFALFDDIADRRNCAARLEGRGWWLLETALA